MSNTHWSGAYTFHEAISFAKFPKARKFFRLNLLLWHGKSVLPSFTCANQKVIKGICVREGARVCVDVFSEQKSHQHQQEWRRTKHQEAMKWMMTMSATGSTYFSSRWKSNCISLLTKQYTDDDDKVENQAWLGSLRNNVLFLWRLTWLELAVEYNAG